ncbi:MAG: hypothetical protein EON90_02140, partial [Brevundimonas sp.]
MLKFILRGAVRFLSLAVAYYLVASRDLSAVDLPEAVSVIAPYAAAFTAIGAIYDVAFGARRVHWRYASIRDMVLVFRVAALTLATS